VVTKYPKIDVFDYTLLSFNDSLSLFLNDGKGTEISPEKQTLSIFVSERPRDVELRDEWQDIINEDKTPPEPFEPAVARDRTIFSNKYFVSFFTTDKDSGLAYYEIKEGGRNFVLAESPYLLRDQSLEGVIQIKAVDKAGNERITHVIPPARPPYGKYILLILGGLLVLGLIATLFRLIKRIRGRLR